jgi:alpha-beta hydrolase superfamily lysophospholipase
MKKQNCIVKTGIIAFSNFIFAGCAVVALELCAQAFGRVEELPYNRIDPANYPREEAHFYSNGNRLQGFIYGSSNNNGLIVISEGLGCTADEYFLLTTYFSDNGWSVFAFNNTGVGGSEGDSVRGLTQSLVDLDAALTYIENSSRFNNLPVMLVGHSWGAYAVCAVLNYNHHNINAVASFSGYNNSREVFEEQGRLLIGGIFYVLTPQFWAIEKQLFGDTAKLTAVDGINKSGIPVMILQGSDDDMISANTTSIYAHRHKIANPLVEIVYLDGEGHHLYNSLELIERINVFFNDSK